MHGGKEEAARKTRALADLVHSTDLQKARRDFSEATRLRVMAAAEQHVETKTKRAALNPVLGVPQIIDAGGLAPSGPAGTSTDVPPAEKDDASTSSDVPLDAVSDMMQQRKAFRDAGFDDEADKVQAKLTQLTKQTERDRVELEHRLIKQRLAELEAEQQEQRETLLRTQDMELMRADTAWRDELHALLEQQADETDEFELKIT